MRKSLIALPLVSFLFADAGNVFLRNKAAADSVKEEKLELDAPVMSFRDAYRYDWEKLMSLRMHAAEMNGLRLRQTVQRIDRAVMKGDNTHTDELAQLVYSSDEYLRHSAIRALGRIGTQQAKTVLDDLLETKLESGDYKAVAEAVLSFGTDYARSKLVHALHNTRTDSRAQETLYQALEKVDPEVVLMDFLDKNKYDDVVRFVTTHKDSPLIKRHKNLLMSYIGRDLIDYGHPRSMNCRMGEQRLYAAVKAMLVLDKQYARAVYNQELLNYLLCGLPAIRAVQRAAP